MFHWNRQSGLDICLALQQFLLEQELFWMAASAFLLAWIGSLFVQRSARLRQVGFAVGTVLFVAFDAATAIQGHVTTAAELWRIGCRGFVAGTFACAIIWLMSPLLLAILALLLTAQRSIVMAYRTVWRLSHNTTDRWRSWSEARRWQRGAPEREQQRQAAQQEQHKREKAQQLCDELRLTCELTYRSLREHLGEAPSPDQWQLLLDRYLVPELGTRVLRRRAQQIEDALRSAAGVVETGATSSLNEVVALRQQRIDELAELGLDEDILDTLSGFLEEAFERQIEGYLKQ